jgi:hypothetical protein
MLLSKQVKGQVTLKGFQSNLSSEVDFFNSEGNSIIDQMEKLQQEKEKILGKRRLWKRGHLALVLLLSFRTILS